MTCRKSRAAASSRSALASEPTSRQATESALNASAMAAGVGTVGSTISKTATDGHRSCGAPVSPSAPPCREQQQERDRFARFRRSGVDRDEFDEGQCPRRHGQQARLPMSAGTLKVGDQAAIGARVNIPARLGCRLKEFLGCSRWRQRVGTRADTYIAPEATRLIEAGIGRSDGIRRSAFLAPGQFGAPHTRRSSDTANFATPASSAFQVSSVSKEGPSNVWAAKSLELNSLGQPAVLKQPAV